MTREGFSHSGRFYFGIQADRGWGEVHLLPLPFLPCVCTLETAYDENALTDHVGTPPCSLFRGLVRWPFSGHGTAKFPLLPSRQAGALD